MSLQRLSYVLLIAVCALLFGFVAGCGGGGDESGGQQDNGSGSQQESGSGGGGETSGARGGTGDEGDSTKTRIALGNIGAVNLDNDRFTLRPTDDRERMPFKLRENTRIELDGQEAKPEDIERGQQAQIQYVVRNERNVARVVTLFSAEGNSGGEGTDG